MTTKQMLSSLILVLAAASSSAALAQLETADMRQAQSSTFPHAPVGSPNIE